MRPTVVLSRLKRCNRGASAVEFAFVFPIFLFIILGLFELGLIGYTSVALESIVSRAGREASIGNMTGTGTRTEQVEALIRERTKPLIGSENIEIINTVLQEGEVGGYETTEPDFCYNPPSCTMYIDNNNNNRYDPPGTGDDFGGAEEVVEIKVRLRWRANFGFIKEIFGNDGVALLSASTIVKNEPFDY